MPTYLNTFWFDKNGHLLQLDDILALRNSQPAPTPAPTPEPGPQPTPTPEPPAAMTIRFRFSNPDFDPNTLGISEAKGNWEQVKYADDNDWDFHITTNNCYELFAGKLSTSDGTTTEIIENGDLSNITTLNSAFAACPMLTSITLSSLTNLTTIRAMCSGLSNLKSVTLLDTTSLTDAYNAFVSCAALTTVVIPNTPKLTECTGMFLACSSLVEIPAIDMKTVTSAQTMYFQCTSLKHIGDIDISAINPSGTAQMFYGCINVESGMLDLYNKMVAQSIGGQGQFINCGTNTDSGKAERAQIPQSYGGTKG